MHGQPCAYSVDLYWWQREGIGIPSVPLSYHVSGENADRRARPDRGLCTPADHGARAEAAVIYVGEVVSEGGAEEVRESGPNVLVEAIGGSEKITRLWREEEGGAPRGGHRLFETGAETGDGWFGMLS